MLILDSILQKLSTILFLLAIILPLFKKGLENNKYKEGKFMFKLATFLDKRHVPIGGLALLLALVHGIIGGVPIISFNWGTICLAAIILSFIPCAFHKEGKKDAGLILHILLSVPALAAFVLHIVLESLWFSFNHEKILEIKILKCTL